jgi:hypothetical protein
MLSIRRIYRGSYVKPQFDMELSLRNPATLGDDYCALITKSWGFESYGTGNNARTELMAGRMQREIDREYAGRVCRR